MKNDFELLQLYVRERSETAFETLMARHAGLVYSSALRLTADTHLAEDITQAVFIVLARKAPQIGPDTVLPAWLLTVTKLTASSARRRNDNQRRIEKETAALNQNRAAPDSTAGAWSRIAPDLDTAMSQLNESDRAALVLRYFKRCSISELAVQLRISPAAADKRVLRALEKLRRFFDRRGVTLSGLALAALLTEHSVHAVPPVLLAALPQAVAAAQGGVVLSSSVLLANGALKAMSLTATKHLAVCACIFLLLGIAGGVAMNSWRASAAPQASVGGSPRPMPVIPSVPPPAVTPPPLRNIAGIPGPAPKKTSHAEPPQRLQELELPAKNLLALVNPAADGINGAWSMDGGTLRTEDRTAFARIELPYVPPEEYDFRIDFTVLEPRGDVAMICGKGPRQLVWKMGAYGNSVAGFENVGGARDETLTRRDRQIFEKNGRYRAVVQVRNTYVAAYLNGTLENWHATDYTDIGLYAFWKLSRPDTLGIGVWATPIQVHAAEIVEVRGIGRPARTQGEVAVPRQKPQLSAAPLWANAVNVLALIDPNRDAVSGRWAVSPEGLECAASPAARLEIPYRPPEEYDFKIVFTRKEGSEDVDQILGLSGKACQWRMGVWKSFTSSGFQCLNVGFEGNNPTTVVGAGLPRNQRVTSIVQVRKNSLAAFVNGRLLCSWNDGFDTIRLLKAWTMPTPGLLGIGSNNNVTVFHSIEVLEITGKGESMPGPAKRLPEPEVPPEPAPREQPQRGKQAERDDAAF